MTSVTIALALTPACATYKVAKTEVFPGVKNLIVAAGPNLFTALLTDLSSWIGWPVDQVESFIGSKPAEVVPPTQ